MVVAQRSSQARIWVVDDDPEQRRLLAFKISEFRLEISQLRDHRSVTEPGGAR